MRTSITQDAQAALSAITYTHRGLRQLCSSRATCRQQQLLCTVDRCRRRIRCQAAEQGGASPLSYGALTERLVGFSSLPFTFIVVPQVLQNYSTIQAGQLSALEAISWIGWVAGLAGNSMMCTYLAARREATAVNVQLIGIVSNVVVLSQLWYAQVMPTNAFAGVLAASLAVSVAGILQSRGKLSERQWMPFEALVGSLGVAAAPQVGGVHW